MPCSTLYCSNHRRWLAVATLTWSLALVSGVSSAAQAAPLPTVATFTASTERLSSASMVDNETVNEQSTSPVQLNACLSSADGGIARYNWSIGSNNFSTTSCSTIWARPTSSYSQVVPATLTVVPVNGRPVSTVQYISFRDVVIASIGDSASSGEGAADPGGTYSLSADCDRSRAAAAAQTALQSQNELGSAVTVHFWFLACTGASTENGLLGPYTISVTHPAQLTRLGDLIRQSRLSPDRLLVQTGANDLDWSSAAEKCLALSVIPFAQELCVAGTTAAMADKVNALPSKYQKLRGAMSGVAVNPTNVYLVEYFDPIDSLRPQPFVCGGDPEAGQVLRTFAASSVEAPLRSTMMAAATGGWHYIGGITNAFQGHGACQLSNAWINTFWAATGQNHINGTWHANTTGQGVVSSYLTAAIRSGLDTAAPVTVAGAAFQANTASLWTAAAAGGR
jgi:hypothetical protein